MRRLLTHPATRYLAVAVATALATWVAAILGVDVGATP